MRSGRFWSLGRMMAVAGAAHADWKITTVAKNPSGQTIQTEYFKDKLKRTGFHDGVNGPLRSVMVINFKNLRETVWDVKIRQYMVRRLHAELRIVAATGPAS